MQEKIEFVTESTIRGRKEISKINEYVNNFNFDCEFKRKIEQVPTTFEELKEWCKNVKDIVIYKDMIFLEREDFGRIEIYNDGDIWCDEHCIGEKRTPPQILNFIKSLTEE